jgi:hypothetical protein
MASFEQLAAQHALEEVSGAESESFATEHRLSRILEIVGWRAASETPSEEVAGVLALILGACVDGHRDLDALRVDIASCLWQYANHLDGSTAPREDWEPTAAQIIDLYAAGQNDAELR